MVYRIRLGISFKEVFFSSQDENCHDCHELHQRLKRVCQDLFRFKDIFYNNNNLTHEMLRSDRSTKTIKSLVENINLDFFQTRYKD